MLTKQVNWIVGADSANVIRWLGKVYTLKAGREGYRVSLVIIKEKSHNSCFFKVYFV